MNPKVKQMPLWRDVNRMLLLIEGAVRQFSRYHKYTLGNDLRKHAGGVSIILKKYDRGQLQVTLCSCFGHYLHASSFKLQQRIFSRFSWLNVIFELQSDHAANKKLLSLWKPSLVISFLSQWEWFHRKFSAVIQLIQLGRRVACAVFKIMRKGKKHPWLDDLYLQTLSALKNIRSQLRIARLPDLFVVYSHSSVELSFLSCNRHPRVLVSRVYPR